jgi:hypothetical protein
MDAHAWINTAGILFTAGIAIYLASRNNLRHQERELAEIKVKVETMWNFLLKRGVVEGVAHGLLSINSPVRLTPESSIIMEHLRVELQDYRKNECPECSESELAMKIEEKFGSRLVHEICIPNNISFSACLLIATAVAKGEHTLTEILDEYEIPKRES